MWELETSLPAKFLQNQKCNLEANRNPPVSTNPKTSPIPLNTLIDTIEDQNTEAKLSCILEKEGKF